MVNKMSKKPEIQKASVTSAAIESEAIENLNEFEVTSQNLHALDKKFSMLSARRQAHLAELAYLLCRSKGGAEDAQADRAYGDGAYGMGDAYSANGADGADGKYGTGGAYGADHADSAYYTDGAYPDGGYRERGTLDEYGRLDMRDEYDRRDGYDRYNEYDGYDQYDEYDLHDRYDRHNKYDRYDGYDRYDRYDGHIGRGDIGMNGRRGGTGIGERFDRFSRSDRSGMGERLDRFGRSDSIGTGDMFDRFSRDDSISMSKNLDLIGRGDRMSAGGRIGDSDRAEWLDRTELSDSLDSSFGGITSQKRRKYSRPAVTSEEFRERYLLAISQDIDQEIGINAPETKLYDIKKDLKKLSEYDRIYLCRYIGMQDQFLLNKSEKSKLSQKQTTEYIVKSFFPESQELQDEAKGVVSYLKSPYADSAFGKFSHALESYAKQKGSIDIHKGEWKSHGDSAISQTINQGDHISRRQMSGRQISERQMADLKETLHESELRAIYGASSKDVCEDVYYGRTEFCILPVYNQSEGRLSGFCRLISKYELKAVLSCTIQSQDSGYTKFLLLKKNIEYRGIKGRSVGFDFSLPPSDGNELPFLILAADLFGMEDLNISSLPAEYSNHSFSYDICCTAPGGADIQGFLCFLALEFPQYNQNGIYPNI